MAYIVDYHINFYRKKELKLIALNSVMSMNDIERYEFLCEEINVHAENYKEALKLHRDPKGFKSSINQSKDAIKRIKHKYKSRYLDEYARLIQEETKDNI